MQEKLLVKAELSSAMGMLFQIDDKISVRQFHKWETIKVIKQIINCMKRAEEHN